VRAHLPLSAAEERVFWPLFREYREDVASVGDRAAALLEDFVEAYPTLDDERAAVLVDDWLSVEQELLDVRRAWVDRFRAALPARTVARFFQIESQFQTLVRAEIAKGVPLVRVAPPNDFLHPPRNPLDAPAPPGR
jgi:hypothetical protein